MAQKSFIQRISEVFTKGVTAIPFIASIAGRYNFATTALLRRDYLREYKNWVFACVQARAEEVGNIKLKLLRKGEEVEQHELLDLINRVNAAMTKHELLFATQAFKDLDGNAFWYLARDQKGKGKIVEIYPLRPDRVVIIPSKTNPLEIEGYIFTQPDGQRVPLGAHEVLHHKNFNPLGGHPFPHRGMGVVEAAAWAIDTDNEARAYNYNFFKNSARPDGILTTPGDSALSQEEYKRLKEEWNAEHRGSDNASKIAVLTGGMKWEEIERTQNDMQFVQQRTMSRDEILSLFRVPKSILGITDDVNRANAEAAIYVFALRTITPLMQQLVDTLNEFLVPEYGDDLELTFDSPVVEDRKKDLEEYAAALPPGASWMSINEIRKRENLPPIVGGDALYAPLTAIAIGSVPEEKPKNLPKPESKTEEKKEPATGAEKELEKLLESRKAKTLFPVPERAHIVKEISSEARENYITLWKRLVGAHTSQLEQALRTFFEAQEKEVLERAQRELKFIGKRKAAGDFLFDSNTAISAGISLITPYLREYIKNSGVAAAALIGLQNFNESSDVLNRFVESRAQMFAESINGTTREALLTSIKEGLDNGEGLDGIENRIASVYGIAKGSRTQTIARTEASAAGNEASKAAYQQGGIEQWQWVVVSPEDTGCLENDGAIVKIGDAFPDGDTQPPVHPNCECTTIPYFAS